MFGPPNKSQCLFKAGWLGWAVYRSHFKLSSLGESPLLGNAGFGMTPARVTMGGRNSHFSFSSPPSDLSRPGSVTFHRSPVSLKVKIREVFLFCGCLIQWFLNLRTHRNCLEGLFTQSARPTPRDSDSVGLGVGAKLCISNKFPWDITVLCY